MIPPRVKICGVTALEAAQAASSAGAWAIGFVFWPGSPRRIAPEAARVIAAGVQAPVAKVGVFVDASPSAVEAVAHAAGLDAIQLHGNEVVEDYLGLGLPVIRAVALASAADVLAAAALPDAVTVLVDARDPLRRGGTGRQADWTLAADLSRRRPIVLAGGIDPTNVGAAIAWVRPWAIDVSSGVEHAPGVKDEVKISALFAAVRAAQVGDQ